jgi:predicted DNA-binding transcriptional regulator AlpA
MSKRSTLPDAATGPARPVEYLNQREVAARYHLSERTIERWRGTGDGPAFVRIGRRRVVYRLADCEAWAAARTSAHRAAEMAGRDA